MIRVTTITTFLTVAAAMLLVGVLVPGAAWAGEPFEIEGFENTITALHTTKTLNEKGLIEEHNEIVPAAQAASHPYEMTTTVALAHHEGEEHPEPNGEPRDAEVNLPAGLIVNPTVTGAKCPEAELDSTWECHTPAVVGVVRAFLGIAGSEGGEGVYPLYSMVAPPGVPAEFGFAIKGAGVVVHLVGKVRTGGDYGLTAVSSDILSKGNLYKIVVTIWGDTTAASHDGERGACAAVGGSCPVERLERPLLTLPSSCTGESLVTSIRLDSWQEIGHYLEADAGSPPVVGCEGVPFAPSLAVRPESHAAGTPTGLEVEFRIPQEESLESLAESDLREASVSLPAGVAVSPSAANGLGVCSEGEIELNGPNRPSCPEASKLGTVEVVTPLLERPLQGAVYLAQQGDLAGQGSNPFGSLFALYLVAEGSGALVKLPGEVKLDPSTGQISAKFGLDPVTGFDLPQLPFSELRMHFFGGQRAPLVMPSSCGSFTTNSVLTPWDGNRAAEPSSIFAVGSGCGAPGFSPSFSAGTNSAQAAGFTPFSMTLSRGSGEQDLSGVQLSLPEGLLGKLARVPRCEEPQASTGECSEGSLLGEATAAVGPGEDPYWAKGGKVYLTGPYNGGPFGLSIVVPTTAGPFTLTGNGGAGREVVRASIRVNSETSQVSVVSDPLPTILEGVPLDIRTVDVTVNRPGFTFNPSGCAPSSVAGTIASTQGAYAGVSYPFQAANCATLPFHPVLTASTDAHTSKADGASLHVAMTSGGIGVANVAKVELTIPAILPSRLSTIQKACTEAQFNTNPSGCPPESDIATAVVHTPLLDSPLSGPVYFVSHGGAAFPDTEIVLQGEGVKLVLDGHTQIKNGITYSRFEAVPDAPFTSFEFNAPEGPYSIFGANENLCASQIHMPITIVGQNGAVLNQDTIVQPEGCPNTITITSHKTSRHTITLHVAVPTAGRLTATGKGLTTATKTTHGRATITLTLNTTHHHTPHTTIHLTFTPTTGHTLTTTLKP